MHSGEGSLRKIYWCVRREWRVLKRIKIISERVNRCSKNLAVIWIKKNYETIVFLML